MPRAMILCIILIALASCVVSAAEQTAQVKIDNSTICPFVYPAPTIDGKLDDACWKSAPQIPEMMFRDSSKTATPKTSVALACDDQGIYIAFRCAEPEMAKIVGSNAKEIWLNDSLEVYLDADRDRSVAQHFVLDAQGRKLQEMMRDGTVSDRNWQVPWEAAVAQGQGEWTAEIFIPWKIAGIDYDAGLAIRANFGRNRRVDGSAQAWYATPDGFNKPLRFGNVFLVRRHTEAKGVLVFKSGSKAGKPEGWVTLQGTSMESSTFTPIVRIYPATGAEPMILPTSRVTPISTTDIPITLDLPESRLYNIDIFAEEQGGKGKWLMQSYQVQLPLQTPG